MKLTVKQLRSIISEERKKLVESQSFSTSLKKQIVSCVEELESAKVVRISTNHVGAGWVIDATLDSGSKVTYHVRDIPEHLSSSDLLDELEMGRR